MLLDRVKPLDAILATAEKKSLHRSLGALQLTLFGIGCIIGTGIFVLTAAGAQKAGPGLMLAFVIAGAVCIVAALCYAEIAAMIPVAGSAYTYSYATMGAGTGVRHRGFRRVRRVVGLFYRHHPQ
jgi:APA family basic amino acid/polyamine antiporter